MSTSRDKLIIPKNTIHHINLNIEVKRLIDNANSIYSSSAQHDLPLLFKKPFTALSYLFKRFIGFITPIQDI